MCSPMHPVELPWFLLSAKTMGAGCLLHVLIEGPACLLVLAEKMVGHPNLHNAL